ncbi:MAG TPA: hypothetical protein DDY77_03445, partial [Clostridiales bacterium]|nr:hypothetical protein [Clostridiales bacterium]
AYVVVCNHLSNTDCFMVGSCFKGKPYFLCKKEWFKHKIVACFFSTCGAIPVDRDNADVQALKTCLKTLKDGKKLIIFPEGTRNKTNERLLPIKGGAGVLAAKTGVNVIPMYIRSKSRFLRRNYLYIGEPIDMSEYFGKRVDRATEEALAEKIRDGILATGDKMEEYFEAKKAKKSK